MEELAGKTAVITGGASGMGRAFADRFASAGMRLVVADVEEPALDRAVEELRAGGADVVGVPTDVSSAEAMDELAAAAFDAFEVVNVVCNNAGVGGGGPMADLEVVDWDWVLGVNLWGVIHGIRVFLPHLIGHGDGHIVNTASVAGLTSFPGMAPYNASKHAVVSISETLFQELGAMGSTVGVSVLCPGLVNTRIFESDRNRPEHLQRGPTHVPSAEEEQMREEMREVFADRLRAGTQPAQVAELVHDAVLAGQLYVLTDEEYEDAIERRHRRIEARENPEVGPHLLEP